MSFYGSRLPHFVEGKTEDEVRQKLLTVAAQLNQKLEIANIYFNSARGRVVAWYFHDIKAAPLPAIEKKTKKKVVRKKKASK